MNSENLVNAMLAATASLVRAAPRLLALVLLLVLCWRAAFWTWQLLPLAPPSLPLASPQATLAAVLARQWFGVSAAPAAVAGGEPAAASAGGETVGPLRLLGIIAGGKLPLALLQLDAKTFELRAGEEFGGRYKLREIARDHVVVDAAGRSQVLSLPTGLLDGPGATPAGSPLPSAPAPSTRAMVPPVR